MPLRFEVIYVTTTIGYYTRVVEVNFSFDSYIYEIFANISIMVNKNSHAYWFGNIINYNYVFMLKVWVHNITNNPFRKKYFIIHSEKWFPDGLEGVKMHFQNPV
jgi:hypothetical protein